MTLHFKQHNILTSNINEKLKMKNIYETLKSTLRDLDLMDEKSDLEVIGRLKANLCFETCDESYELWMEHIVKKVINN